MPVIYKPIKALASGGMADVFIGIQYSDTGFSRLCAIKRIKGQSDDDEEFVSMFRDEAKICQTLQHANVVQVIDFTIMDDSCALIMEFVQGVNLSSLLKKFRLQQQFVPIPVVLYICAEVAKGLQYVHTRTDPITDQNLNIVHRDISPSNVLISYEGEIKITDFGIAKAHDNSHQTQVGVIKGKYQYMSPEQFQARPTDHRTDVYALGCILWESLAGRKMFTAANEAHLLQLVMHGPPENHLRDHNPEVDDSLNQIVRRAINIDQSQRYSSAGQFANDLTGYLNHRYKQFSAIDMTAFIREYLSEELEANKAVVKEVLETFNNSEHLSSPGQPSNQFLNSKAGHAQSLSHGPHIDVGANPDGTIQISTNPGTGFSNGTHHSGINVTIDLGDGQNQRPLSAKGIDLDLDGAQSIARAWPRRDKELSKEAEEDVRLGWTEAQREITAQRRAVAIRPTNKAALFERVLLLSTLAAVVGVVGLFIFQYILGIDVVGGIQILAAKLNLK